MGGHIRSVSSPVPAASHPTPEAGALLAWYDRNRRLLPWRALPGETADPYRVWLSEIMLQQTTVAAVIPYYKAFVRRFPSIEALAAASLEEVLGAWAGLGYYLRARNLHACARAVVANGGFPRAREELRSLPGIGPYTAAAIRAIAFGLPGVPVDGNVERVAARLFAIDTPLPAAKPLLRQAAAALAANPLAVSRASDFAQALFDLGATVCTPISPACMMCPWREPCRARARGIAAELPRRSPTKERPRRHGVHFWLTDANGLVLLRRRPENGLLGGMEELPGTPWREEPWRWEEASAHAPMAADWQPAGEVRQAFTHLELRIALYSAQVPTIMAEGNIMPRTTLAAAALPSVMRKCVAMAEMR